MQGHFFRRPSEGQQQQQQSLKGQMFNLTFNKLSVQTLTRETH